MKLLTNLIFEPKGKHDPSLAYSIKDTVMSPDGSKVYFALQDVPAGIALDNEDYWKLQIDLSSSKSAMDQALASFGNYAKEIGMRVRGETAKASGNPVTFLPDAGSLLQPVTVLEPQQLGSGDLYPAGGGKNKLNPGEAMANGNFEHYGVTGTWRNDGDLVLNGTLTNEAWQSVGITMVTAGNTYTVSVGGNVIIAIWDRVANAHVGNVYLGVPATFVATNTGAYAYAFASAAGTAFSNERVMLMVNEGSEALPWEPSINIRPFIGYDKLGLNHETENLCNLTFGVVPSVNDGLDAEVEGWASDYVYIGDNDVVLSHRSATDKCTFFLLLYDEHKNYIGHALGMTRDTEYLSSASISGHENARYCRCRLDDPTYMAASKTKLHLEFSTNGTPIKGKLHTVQIGQTVYGFRYEWLTGKAVIEWAMYTVTVGDFAKNGANQFVMTHNLSVQAFAECSCSHFIGSKRGAYDSAVNNSATVSGTGLWFYSKAFETAEEFNAFINAQYAAGTPVQIVYKPATRIEIQLTPHIITAVEPEQTNTLYGDGTIEVEYVKPLHVSIEERVAAALAAAAE